MHVDLLSDVITAVRTGAPHSTRTRRFAPWRSCFAASEAAGFHVVLAGSCLLLPGGHDPVPMTTGDVAFLPRGHAHDIADSPHTPPGAEQAQNSASTGVETVLLCGAYGFDRSLTHPLMDQLPDVVHIPGRLGRHSPLRHGVELLAGELDGPGPGSDAVVPALLDVLLVLILRSWLHEQAGTAHPIGWARALADPGLARVLDAVHTDPAHPWTVTELAAKATMSRATFARQFGTLLGHTPIEYLTWWRLTTAAHLLRTDNASLAVVAGKVGYTSEYAFATAFKRQYGTAPGRYRRTHLPDNHP